MKFAIASIQRNRNPYIVEWIAFHLAMGFNQFYIYSHKTSDGMTETLLQLSKRYPIQVFALDMDDFPQIHAYRHAWQNFGDVVDWMAFIDGDEFLFPTKQPSIQEALAPYAHHAISALGVFCKCYGSNGHLTDPDGLILENFPRHSRADFEPNRHIKSIVRGKARVDPERSDLFNTEHGTFDEHLRPITQGVMREYEPTYDFFRINHYAVQSKDFSLNTKQGIGAADLSAGFLRSGEWVNNHDKNDEDDGISLSLLPTLKKKFAELSDYLSGGRDHTKLLYIHQIYYDEATRASIDPEFIPLDNSANERPDWREYWPIRTFLKAHVLDPNAYYGFFSPKFQIKTGLTGANVLDFIGANAAEVYTFSPFIEQSSFFLNAFEHGEANHPGLMAAMQQLIDSLGIHVDLRAMVGDFTNTVFSNYFVAKASFWVKWLELGERLYALSESEGGPLAAVVNGSTKYHEAAGEVALKVFMMERIVTFILMLDEFSTKPYDPFAIARSGIPASLLDHEMRIANGLKMAFSSTRDSRYIDSFIRFRNSVIERL